MTVRPDGRPRRVALVTQGFERGGGVPAVVRWLRDGLESHGDYTVDIHDLATSSRDPESRRILAPTTWLRRSLTKPLDQPGQVRHWGANAVEIEAMRYRPRTELTAALNDYDLIQVVAGGPALAVAVVAAGVPVALQVATTAAEERRSRFQAESGALRLWHRAMMAVTSRLEGRALRDVDVVLVENDVMLEHVRAAGHSNVIKAPPGTDTDRFVPHPGGWQRDGYALSVCRFGDPRKGLDRLVLAYYELTRSAEPSPELVLAGRGTIPSTLIDQIAELGLTSRVSFRQNVEPDELIRLYQGAAVFLQTSHEEGLGIAVLEAMACGLPTICTDTAGTRESVVPGETGWLIPQEPAGAVPLAVAARLGDVLSGGTGAEMGAHARTRCVARYSRGATLARFTTAYDEMLARDA